MEARRQRCTARVSDGSRPCARWAINGSTVCATHGGRAPQVKKSARERLGELVEPALKGLHKALKSEDLPTIVRASQIVLDRCGFHPSQAIELTGKDGSPVQVQSNVSVDSLPLYVRQLLVLVSNGEGIGEEIERVLTEEMNERFGRFLASRG
jgi:hypothetical protein